MKFFALALLFPLVAQAECPVGPNHDHLTIHQVMVNFGSFTLNADLVTSKLTDPWKPDVSDDEISAAAIDLSGAIECADIVLANPAGDLLPDGIANLKGEVRKKAIEGFLSFMGDFRDLLVLYQNSLKDYLATSLDKRDATAIDRIRSEIDDTVDEAHRKTTPNSFSATLAETLESVMKQLKVLLKQLLADAGDDAKSAANAAAATQMASLFHKAQTFTPDSIDEMPESQRAAALAEYRNMLDQEAALATQLAQALLNKDHATIDQLMKKMSDVKEQGHDKFDP